jgi:sugar lactone lactonase YvrE
MRTTLLVVALLAGCSSVHHGGADGGVPDDASGVVDQSVPGDAGAHDLALNVDLEPESYVVSTFANVGTNGLAVDKNGVLYATDGNAIAKVDSSGTATIVAGNPSDFAFMDGTGGSTGTARFDEPSGMCIDGAGNVYVADTDNNRVRKIDTGGNVTTFAGNGTQGFMDGTGGASGTAEFYEPASCVFDGSGNLYVTDPGGHRIRKIDSGGNVTTFTGNGTNAHADGTGGANGTTSFMGPWAIVYDGTSTFYVSDDLDETIRKIDSAGNSTTLTGRGTAGFGDGSGGYGGTTLFDDPAGLAIDQQGYIYVADAANNRIRRIDSAGNTTTFAGIGVGGLVDGPALEVAQLKEPVGLTVDKNGVFYVGDTGNDVIRKISLVP